MSFQIVPRNKSPKALTTSVVVCMIVMAAVLALVVVHRYRFRFHAPDIELVVEPAD